MYETYGGFYTFMVEREIKKDLTLSLLAHEARNWEHFIELAEEMCIEATSMGIRFDDDRLDVNHLDELMIKFAEEKHTPDEGLEELIHYSDV